MAGYRDRWIACTDEQVTIRGYYIPWGTKRIPYDRIRSVTRVRMGAFTGRGRLWGTFDVRFWASLDPLRPTKGVGLILDVGAAVKPFITPDDPEAALDVILSHIGAEKLRTSRSPIV